MASLPVYEDSACKPSSKHEDCVQMQHQDVPSLPPDLYRPEVDTSAVDPRKLKRKIDFQLLPWLSLLYLMSFLDKGSIGNARVCTPLQAHWHASCVH